MFGITQHLQTPPLPPIACLQADGAKWVVGAASFKRAQALIQLLSLVSGVGSLSLVHTPLS